MRVNTLFAFLTFIIIIIVVLMADSVVTAIAITVLLLNFLAISAYWDKLKKGYASINAVGWGSVPDEKEPAEEEQESIEDKEKKEKTSRVKSLLEENRGLVLPENTDQDQNTNLYGRAQEEYDNYINAYSTCWREAKPAVFQSCSEQDYSIDAANALMAQRRARDKRCMDGLVSKDANFYRHHYAEELDEAENKPWWSRGEF